MKSASMTTSVGAIVLALSSFISGSAAQNLLQNPGFENGSYTGTNTFVDNLNSLALANPAPTHNNAANALNYWGSDAAQWIDDSSRATGGNRFLWLAGGGTYCAGQELGFGIGQSLVGGNTYRFTFDWAAVGFNGGDPGNATALDTTGLTGGRLELNWVDSDGAKIEQLAAYETEELTNGFGGGPLSLQPVVTWNSLQTTIGTAGSGWYRGFVDVTLPGAGPTGTAGLLVSFSNSNQQELNAGLAIDNASVVLVPEPGSLCLLGATLLPLLRRRRRK